MGAVAGDQLPKIVRLKCSVKNYDWGKVGNQSGVARVYSNNSRDAVDDNERYAEFWMGTHDSGPSYVVVDDFELVSLKDWIKRNPNVLGDKVVGVWGANLPFLFKVIDLFFFLFFFLMFLVEVLRKGLILGFNEVFND